MLAESEVIALISLIAGYDNRFANDVCTRAAWGFAARDAHWNFDAACAAVRRYYNRPLRPDETLPRIAPGHLTYLIRTARPGGHGPLPAAEILATRGPGSSAEHRRRVRIDLAARLGAVGRFEDPREIADSLVPQSNSNNHHGVSVLTGNG
ncbi:hypothetical protein OHB26_16265 [Nocardia sp. NBC_01503]|uniref:hypothetical protein n=1 Tax=Nocardia sp. NBC_01503 TaxID=2975997 RepID=UPI002E7C109E|nr:hypothetical protein [Nocardia sp. NBC_01503]WTL35605.1 hypothetical protein OHB26_16265 [Nocardia sp. NBC_01503]